MKKNFHILFLATLLISGVGLSAHAGVIHPDLQASLEALGPDEEISVIVTLSDRAEIDHIKDRHKGIRRMRIIRALKEKADLTQKRVIDYLTQRKTRRLISLWLINGLAITVKADVIRDLATLPGIESIMPDYVIPAPVTPSAVPAQPQWNINMIQAPQLWDIGYTGQGIVVANMDTGVDYTHPDLASRWRGGTNSWYDPNGQHAMPYDAHGHGTMTMGVMVGGDAGGPAIGAIGVAPGAKWIAVKIFADGEEYAPSSSIHQGFDWLLDPDGNPDTDDAPDVVNNSWGGGTNRCFRDFERDIQTLKAAGIALVFSAGNDGPGASTSDEPANNLGSFSVGAVDRFMNIARFSSRGPSACDDRVFPDVVAPGVAIRSAFPGGWYQTWDGTSFSAPHVAGAMALVLSAIPDLTVSELELRLKQTAVDLGESGPDNSYGSGLIDVVSAYYNVVTTSFVSIKADDGWIRESAPGSGIGGAKRASGLLLGDDSRKRQYRSILSFDTTGIPPGATINSGVLRVKRRHKIGRSNPFETMGPCYADIVDGTFGQLEELEKDDFQAAVTASQAATLSDPAAQGGYSTGVLKEEGLAAINKGGITQFRLYCSLATDGNRSRNLIRFFGSENRDPENRPVLEIVYTP